MKLKGDSDDDDDVDDDDSNVVSILMEVEDTFKSAAMAGGGKD